MQHSPDFDFFIGHWRVRHRRLKSRLSGDTRWDEFNGAAACRKIAGGVGNVDDNSLDLPGGAYEAMTLRLFDGVSWSIWWIDSRSGVLDPPVRGGFAGGVGTFIGDDVFEGRPIKVRFIWSDIGPEKARWEQAFSPDGGASWEVNWIMQFERVQ